ncbi:MAG: efflux RND transporter permease subunit [Acidobacteria bacterium]|nr:efflux RND transporter permease subunit [Acidobacteriota bacterium]
MIHRIVGLALQKRVFTLAIALALIVWGVISFRALPIEAYPDVANNYVSVITQWPGRAAEEVEQQVTIPVETVMAGIPHLEHLRSTTLFGLSSVMMIFDDESDNEANRQMVLERLAQFSLPQGLQPVMGTDWSPVGQIYFYHLISTNPKYDVMELKALQDWTLLKQFKSVPNVVDVSSLGGMTREYQVLVDPNKLIAYGLTLAQVEQQLTGNNLNAGGSFIQSGMQQINVRAVGLVSNVQDIEDTVITARNGTALRVKDIAQVQQGARIRLGRNGKAIHREDGRILDNNDVVEGIVLLRKGAEGDATLRALHEKVKELNERILPPGVKVVPFLDRSDLVHFTSHTVEHNLTEGMLLVSVILFLFLGNIRGAIIIALCIPFSLMFASICLDLRKIPANLLSLGALDFGMVVDGAVVMVENIIRHLGQKEEEGRYLTVPQKIKQAVHEVQRPVFYAITIIITAYLPIFTLQRVEGRLFRPMAWTVSFALLGALVFSMFIAPVVASFVFRNGAREWHNPVVEFLLRHYRVAVNWAVHHVWAIIGASLLGIAATVAIVLSGAVGSEFLPHLDEGAIWVRGTLAPSTGPDESIRLANQARILLAAFPEVNVATSQVGRADDGTDTTGFFNTEYFVDLKPRERWRPVFHQDKDQLIAAMNHELTKIPGVVWNFSQPISDNMEEAVSGVKGQLAVKIYGDDLKTLEEKANAVVDTMRGVNGVADLAVFRVIGQPNLNISIDRARAGRYQLNVADVQDAVQTAVGGTAVTQVLKGEQRFDLVLRYQEPFRRTQEAIANIRLLAPSGERVSLAQLCNIQVQDGASQIYREGFQRYIAVKYSVRGRDLGSTVEEAMSKVDRQVKLPPGYKYTWAGEYESQKRSQARLMLIVPLTIFLIFMILYSVFSSSKWASLILMNLLIAPSGGVLALLLTGTYFSVSSGVGFLALFGASVQVGVIMVEYINQLRARGMTIVEATVEGAVRRLRPIMMTMLVATLGLLPAATSHAIGSDSQRPFAIVIVGGLVANLLVAIFVLPALYVFWARPADRLPEPDDEPNEA